MGAGQSISQAHPPSHALHVLRVTPSSPASQTSIEPFFDFVIGIEGDSLSTNIDVSELERIVEYHEGNTLNLLVWNSKNQDTRVVPIIPSRAWSLPDSQSSNPKEPESALQPSLLGLSMRMCEPEFAIDNVWHVMDVLEGSPAESAGLVPYGDWVIGWSGGVLSAEGDFYDLVEAHIDKPLRVYVYSHDFDALREVVLVPNRQWGGEGLLGCVFGFGLLHRIPSQPLGREPGATPPELQEPEFEEQELFVPADASEEGSYDPAHVAEWRQHKEEQWAQRSHASRSMYEQTTSLPEYSTSRLEGRLEILEEGDSNDEENRHYDDHSNVHHHHPVGDRTNYDHSHHDHDHSDDDDDRYDNNYFHRPIPDTTTLTPRTSLVAGTSTAPTRSPFGTLMNGSGNSMRLNNSREHTPIPMDKTANTLPSRIEDPEKVFGHNEDSSEDGSIAGTEATGGGRASLGSLTSVD